MKNKIVHSALFGLAIGDALGVPVEFQSRKLLKRFPVVDFREYGAHGQPKGTWSDDSSLTFCLAECLCAGYDIEEIAKSFANWKKYGYWGAHNKVFDIGGTTKYSLDRILDGVSAKYSGNIFEEDNGNGSLMRIIPLVFYLKDENIINKVYEKVKEISSITHAHFRSVFSCFIYVVFGIELLKNNNKFEVYNKTKHIVNDFINTQEFNTKEIKLFYRLLECNIANLEEDDISSTGYVLHSLEASIWCLLTSESYKETVLKAVNLGDDTDTTGAIAGGLAGILYGCDNIPDEWLNQVVRKDDIAMLSDRFSILCGIE